MVLSPENCLMFLSCSLFSFRIVLLLSKWRLEYIFLQLQQTFLFTQESPIWQPHGHPGFKMTSSGIISLIHQQQSNLFQYKEYLNKGPHWGMGGGGGRGAGDYMYFCFPF